MQTPVAKWSPRRIESVEQVSRSGVKINHLGTEITLSIADVGSVTVNSGGVTSVASGTAHHDRLAAIAGDWAWGQWLAFGGRYAFHGATLTREGFTLALVGAPRAGVSLAALALCRRGWSLIADGVCPLVIEDERVIAEPGVTALQVDRAVTAAFPPAEGFADANTPRARSNIDVRRAAREPVGRIISLVTSTVRRDGIVLPGDFEGGNPTLSLAASAVCGDGIRSRNRSLDDGLMAMCAQAVELVPFDVALVPAGSSQLMYSPSQIATLITDHLDEVTASV